MIRSTTRCLAATALVGLTLPLLAACGPGAQLPTVTEADAAREAEIQMEIAGDRFRRRNLRLNTVHWRLSEANAELCAETERGIGATIADADSFKTSFLQWTVPQARQAENAVAFFQADDRLRALEVVPGSPAYDAGMKVRDVITRIGSTPVPPGAAGRNAFRSAWDAQSSGVLQLQVDRNGSLHAFEVVPEEVCAMPAVLLRDDTVNAYADGERIYVTTGMLRFLESDDELALILAHEMAHNARGHIEAKRTNILLGSILGGVLDGVAGGGSTAFSELFGDLGAAAYSQEFEAEADYVGVYFAGRAGFDVSGAAWFWRRLSAEHPEGIHLAGSTHPANAVRFALVQRASEELIRKRERGLPLLPEEKPPSQ